MMGDALNHTPISDVAFTHKNSDDGHRCSLILNSIINNESLIQVRSKLLDDSFTILDIFYCNGPSIIEDFYCLKTIYDFMVEGVMIYQIFEVNIKSLTVINDFWLTR